VLFLQLENSLADARADLEKAGETLHDAAVKAAQLKSEYDLKADVVRRLEGALRALHGEPGTTPAPGSSQASSPSAPKQPRPPAGPACAGCGEVGKLVREGPLVICTVCQAQSVAA